MVQAATSLVACLYTNTVHYSKAGRCKRAYMLWRMSGRVATLVYLGRRGGRRAHRDAVTGGGEQRNVERARSGLERLQKKSKSLVAVR
jgi:hypothetical protein